MDIRIGIAATPALEGMAVGVTMPPRCTSICTLAYRWILEDSIGQKKAPPGRGSCGPRQDAGPACRLLLGARQPDEAMATGSACIGRQQTTPSTTTATAQIAGSRY